MIMKKILLLMAIVAVPLVFISCGDDKDEPAAPDGHQYVDLGLPSGTLWATCNIGANSPEEYGDYFAWGETVPKAAYEWCTCDRKRADSLSRKGIYNGSRKLGQLLSYDRKCTR